MANRKELIQEVKNLIRTNKTDKALEILTKEHLSSLDKEIIILNNRFTKVEEDLRYGIIDDNLAQRKLNKINYDILALTEIIENKATPEEHPVPSQIKKEKKFNKWLIYTPLLLAVIAIGFYLTKYQGGENSDQLKIGDYYEGGIVFQIDDTGKVGKVLSESDLGSYDWYEAKSICQEYRGGGYTDWHLPSREELDVIYNNFGSDPQFGFKQDWYWSSSETNGEAWEQDFTDGYQQNDGGGNNSLSMVRAIRNFSKLKIGDKFAGGIVFDLELNNQNGKVFSEYDLGKFNWYEAKTKCQEFNEGGYTDWYLPSREELDVIYINFGSDPQFGFKQDWYWSSSETNGEAWEQDFTDGYQQNDGGGNNSLSMVRAIRSF